MTNHSPYRASNAAWARSLLLWPGVFDAATFLAYVIGAEATGFEGAPGPLAVYGCSCSLFLYWFFVSLPLSLTDGRPWGWRAIPIATSALFLAAPVALLRW
ncbi:hypothetical protein [Glycomyces tenuis]|uniref:hypothetical protein n=1 Tax=Glycomyces tenuis TaxID=58116 RepID=UPI0012DE9B6C|nr:hypothetical protein [Glycomyces tenuis]